MSGGPPWMPAPVCLIENAKEGLRTVESALDILRGIQQPLVVVAVVGLYRTGKSYLMNRLAGQQSGFALGSTLESKTKGIWMWCVPHPSKPGHTLLLLDTEGLGDVGKGDSKNDAWIFCLGVLLSSTLVYNSRGTIDNQALEKLHYVTELTDHIRIKSAAARDEDDEEEDCKFVRFFPGFVWAVRDFTLERKIDGRNVSEDEYLDFALQLKKGQATKVLTYNQPRQCIRNFFPTRKCFTFPFPTSAKKMMNLDSMAEADICPDFLSVANRFCSYVFAESHVKTVQGGHKVTGSRFSHLVKIYVDTINSGAVPCLENAVVAMAEIENQSAMNEGFRLYEQGMGDLSKTFPMDVGTASAEHQRLYAMATKEFLKHSFKDEKGKYTRQLAEKVTLLSEKLITLNMEASEKLCQKLLLGLYATMAINLKQGRYSKAGGYEIYCRDRDAMVAKYRQHDKKGMKGEKVLEEFLQEKNAEANFILKADEKLTEVEKEMAEAREQARVQEQKAKAEEQRSQDLQRALEDERRSQEARVRCLQEKMEEEMQLQREELKQALDSKLKEQREMLEKGFKDQADIMGQEIEQLKKEMQKIQEVKPGFFEQVIMPLANIGTGILSNYLQYKQL
ncbi:guanylate-binding protein 1-like [Clupea harengus]|uniref:Guanylate-binding protein 1-like n=1 Tax=Clupea harengus TaxID=7950 RepID=A0A8M1K6N3_CLUHA|nr:guanylate-binding protein 1-like [Clupea harengus]